MKDLSKQNKRNKARGSAFERLVVNAMKSFFPETERNLAQTRDGGYDAISGPFIIECKHGKAVGIWAAFEQVKAACKKAGVNKTPVVVARKLHGETVAVLRFEDFLKLVEGTYGRRTGSEICEE